MQGILMIIVMIAQIAGFTAWDTGDGIPFAGMMPELVVTAPRYYGEETAVEEVAFAPIFAYAGQNEFQDIFLSEVTSSGDYYLAKEDTAWDDVNIKGGNAQIEGVIIGDLTVMGGRAVIKGKIDGDAAVFGGNLDIFGSISGDAAVFGGNINNRGYIEGDLIVIGGTVSLDSASVVEGDVSTLGGSIERNEDAIVEGEITSISTNLNEIIPRITKAIKWSQRVPYVGALRGVFILTALVILYILNLLLLLIFPGAIEKIINKIQSAVWISVGIGIGLEILYIPLIVLFAVSIVGIPVIPIFALAVFVAFLFGFSSISVLVGERVAQGLKISTENRIGIFSLGWIAIMIIPILGLYLKNFAFVGGLVFVLGLAIFYVSMTIGLGAVLYSLFKRKRRAS